MVRGTRRVVRSVLFAEGERMNDAPMSIETETELRAQIRDLLAALYLAVNVIDACAALDCQDAQNKARAAIKRAEA